MESELYKVSGTGEAGPADGFGGMVSAVLLFAFPGARIGVSTFVERLKISLPCTMRLSFDFFRSFVSISDG